MPIAAITLTEDELAELATLVTPEEFKAWTRQMLGEYIERLTELRAQQEARAVVTAAVAAVQDKFPSVFAPVEEVVTEEPVAEEPVGSFPDAAPES